MNNSIVLTTEDGETLTLFVEEKTRINGKEYILAFEESVSDDDDEAECYIFRDDSKPEDSEAVYVMVEDDTELDCVLDIFQNLIDG